MTSDLNRVIRDVREFIVGLEQHPHSGHEFRSALKALTLANGAKHPTRIDLRIEDEAAERLDSHAATQLLQVAREAMREYVKSEARSQKPEDGRGCC